MYLLFLHKGWAPGQYWGLPAVEKALIRGFLIRELKQRAEARRR